MAKKGAVLDVEGATAAVAQVEAASSAARRVAVHEDWARYARLLQAVVEGEFTAGDAAELHEIMSALGLAERNMRSDLEVVRDALEAMARHKALGQIVREWNAAADRFVKTEAELRAKLETALQELKTVRWRYNEHRAAQGVLMTLRNRRAELFADSDIGGAPQLIGFNEIVERPVVEAAPMPKRQLVLSEELRR